MLRSEIWLEPESDIATEEALRWEPLWRVIIHNDDITPVDFVIDILLRLFGLDQPKAELITWTAHTTGIAYVMSLAKKDAERRIGRAHFAASLEGYPLTFTIEPE